MDYRKLISESWSYTQSHKSLIRWFGFFPAIFTTTVGAWYIFYQFFAFKKSWIFDNANESFFEEMVGLIWDFITGHVSLTVPLIIFGVIFLIFYLLLPTVAMAGAIQTIARNRNGQEAGVGTGLRHGIMSFLPLIEYHLLIKTFSFFAILIEMSFVVRNLGPVIFQFLLPVFVVFVFLSIFLTLLFTFTDFFIVVDGDKVFESMKKSAKLVITHWKHTFLITLLMIIIGLRIVIQAVLVFLIPALVVFLMGYLTTLAFASASVIYIVGGVVGGVGLLLSAYLNGIVDIFAYSVWTFAFLDLTNEEEVSAREIVQEIKDDIKTDPDHHYEGHKNL